MGLAGLAPAKGATKKRKRVGRGPACSGKTSGRGSKGHKSRSGYRRRPGFEGGQMPLHRRIPKRGFTNIFKADYLIVNIGQLEPFPDGARVTPDELYKAGILRKRGVDVKILGDGDLGKQLTVVAHKFSKEARRKIEAARGQAELIA